MGISPRNPGGRTKEFAGIFVRGYKHEAMPIVSVRSARDGTVTEEFLYLNDGPYGTDPHTWTVNDLFKVECVTSTAMVYVYLLQDAVDSDGVTYTAGSTLASYYINSTASIFVEKIFYPLSGKSWS